MRIFFVIIFVTVVSSAVSYAEEQKEVSLDLAEQIGNFYSWALGIGGLVALGVLIFGGILYTTSAGNASRQGDAKEWIIGALIGLLILFGSWFILNTINPELTKLTDLKLLMNEAAESVSDSGDSESGSGSSSPFPVINGETCPVAPGFSMGSGCGAPRPQGGAGPGGHQGVDLMGQLGSALYAIEDGMIDGGWGWNYYGGWRFWLYADSGNKYYYAHTLSKEALPPKGKRVRAGEQIGYLGESGQGSEGTTGNVGGPHLHLGFQAKSGGPACGDPSYTDPLPLIRAVCYNSPSSNGTNDAPLNQVLDKSQYSSFGVSFQEIGREGASINSSKQFQSASLYKLFVAKYLYEQREKGRISFDQPVDLTRINLKYAKEEDQRDGTPYPWGSRTKIPIKECLPQMISASENACGAALKLLARELAGGESQVNAQIGGNTTLYPQRTTAEDVANLLSQIAQGKVINQTVSTEFERLLNNQIHRDKIPKGVPIGARAGNKTGEIWPDEGLGYTNSHDAAIIRYNGKTYILVVLTSYNPADGRTNQTIQQLTSELFGTLK